MAFDGIVTKTICKELQNIIGYKIDKIYEPDINTLILGLYKKTYHLNLLSCIASNNYRIHLTKHVYKNPEVAPNFCMLLRKHIIGYKIKNIYCKGLERVVFLEIENTDNPNKPIVKKIIIELMGKHSNIILTDVNENIIDSIRHTSTLDNSLRDIYPTCKYLFPKSNKFNFLDLSDENDFFEKIEESLTDEIASKINKNADNLTIEKSENVKLSLSDFNIGKIVSNTFNGISNSSINGLLKTKQNIELSKDSILKLYNDILNIVNSNISNLKFEPILKDNIKKDFFLINSGNEVFENHSLSYYLDDFYYYKEKDEIFKNYRNNILHLILLTLKKYEKRLENIDVKLEECKNMEKYRLYGELITANLYRTSHNNLSEIELENYYDNNSILKIPLDKKYSPSINAKRYFKKYNKLKNALDIVTKQKKETINEINYLESIVYELESAQDLDSIQEIYLEISASSLFDGNFDKKIAKNLNIKNKNSKRQKRLTTNKEVSFNPLKFNFEGYRILVGRNNKENDYLTLKYANKNDLWFHTKDIHGSHVILKIDSEQSSALPEDVIYEAARLAAFHSKAKNSTNIPVDFCKVSFVKKPKGSKPGMVIYSNNKTIYVK